MRSDPRRRGADESLERDCCDPFASNFRLHYQPVQLPFGLILQVLRPAGNRICSLLTLFSPSVSLFYLPRWVLHFLLGCGVTWRTTNDSLSASATCCRAIASSLRRKCSAASPSCARVSCSWESPTPR